MWPLTPFIKKKEVDFSHFDYLSPFYKDLFGLIRIEIISQDWYNELSHGKKEKILLRIQLSKVRMRQDLNMYYKSTIGSIKEIGDKKKKGHICLLSDYVWDDNEELIPYYYDLFSSLFEIRSIIRFESDSVIRKKRISKIAKTLFLSYGYLVEESIRFYEEVMS